MDNSMMFYKFSKSADNYHTQAIYGLVILWTEEHIQFKLLHYCVFLKLNIPLKCIWLEEIIKQEQLRKIMDFIWNVKLNTEIHLYGNILLMFLIIFLLLQ